MVPLPHSLDHHSGHQPPGQLVEHHHAAPDPFLIFSARLRETFRQCVPDVIEKKDRCTKGGSLPRFL